MSKTLKLSISLLVLLLLACFCNHAVAHPGSQKLAKLYTDKITQTPNNASHYIERAKALISHQDFQLAIDDLLTALEVDRESKIAHFYLAQAQRLARKYKGSKKHIDIYVSREPKDPRGYLERALINTQLRDMEAAITDFTTAIKYSKNPAPELFLTRYELQLGCLGENPNRAIIGLEEAVRRLGPLVTLIDVIIEHQEKRNEHQKAISALKKLPNRIQQLPKYLNKVGEIYLALGLRVEAELSFRSAHHKLLGLPQSRKNTLGFKRLIERVESNLTSCCSIN